MTAALERTALICAVLTMVFFLMLRRWKEPRVLLTSLMGASAAVTVLTYLLWMGQSGWPSGWSLLFHGILPCGLYGFVALFALWEIVRHRTQNRR